MTFRLRIAGIYYAEFFDFAALTPNPAFSIPGRLALAGGNPTILELLEASVRNPGKDIDEKVN